MLKVLFMYVFLLKFFENVIFFVILLLIRLEILFCFLLIFGILLFNFIICINNLIGRNCK